jgi:hypothetical protein
VHCARRFRLFAPYLQGATLDDQTRRFARVYLAFEAPRRAGESTDAEVIQVLALFRAWYASKVSGEIAHHEVGELAAPPVAAVEQLAPGLKSYAVAVWNTDNVNTSVSFAVDPSSATVTISIVSQAPGGPSSNTMVLTGARKSASGSEVTGYAQNQPDGSGGTFTAYLKLQVLPTEMVVLVYKHVPIAGYTKIPGNERHYRYQNAGAQAGLLAFIAGLELGPSEFEVAGPEA